MIDTKTGPKVSVILATRNESHHIDRVINSILQQDYPNVEIIVVDNNSSDDTREKASKILGATHVYNLADYISLDGIKNFRGAQVNFGISRSEGNVVFFPDADMTFDHGLIAEAVEKLQKFDALYVPEEVIGSGFLGLLRAFERNFYNGTCIDAVRFMWIPFFRSIGGFDEKNIAFGFDDWDLTLSARKFSASFAVTTKKIYHHEQLISLRTYLKKKSGYAEASTEYRSKWKGHIEVKKQFSVFYRYFLIFIENGNWRKVARNPHLMVALLILRSLVGFTYVRGILLALLIRSKSR